MKRFRPSLRRDQDMIVDEAGARSQLPDFKLFVPELFTNTTDDELVISDDKAIRFLVARKGDFKKTRNMLVADREFRREYRPKSITQDSIHMFLKSGCWRVIGQAKGGQPVIWSQTGLWNPYEYSPETYESFCGRGFRISRGEIICLVSVAYLLEKLRTVVPN